MAIQLIVRSRQPEPGAVFAAGTAHTFDGHRIRFGGGPECDCVLPPAAGLPTAAGTFTAGTTAQTGWRLVPAPGVSLQLNGKPVTSPTLVASGDEVQCGQWSVYFHHQWPPARHSPWADSLSLFAQLLAGLILITEIALVAWLPRRIQSARLWEGEIARQRVGLLLDDLRRGNAKAKPGSDLELAARRLVSEQLDHLAAFVRRRQDILGRDTWRQIESDLREYDTMLRRLGNASALKPLPEPNAETAVRLILNPPPATPPPN